MKAVLYDCLSRIQRTFVGGSVRFLRPRLLAAILLAASGFYFGLLRSSSTSGRLPVATNDSRHFTENSTLQSPISNRYPPSETAITQERISFAALPPRVTDALSNSWKIPHQLDDSSIGLVSEEVVLRSFSEHSSPSNRFAHLSFLGTLGGDAAASRLIRMMTDEFAGTEFKKDDYLAMVRAIVALGCISSRSAFAKEFLENAVSEDYWAIHRTWSANPESPNPEHQMNAWLARECLKALGIGGNDAAVAAVIQRIQNLPIEEQREWSGAVVDTHFNLDRAKQRKRTVLLTEAEDLLKEYAAWMETESGKKWSGWYDSLLQGKPQTDFQIQKPNP